MYYKTNDNKLINLSEIALIECDYYIILMEEIGIPLEFCKIKFYLKFRNSNFYADEVFSYTTNIKTLLTKENEWSEIQGFKNMNEIQKNQVSKAKILAEEAKKEIIHNFYLNKNQFSWKQIEDFLFFKCREIENIRD